VLQILFTEPKKGAKGPAIFIDRDGVINQRRPGDYVLDWSQFVFVPGIREALKQLATLGPPLIVISNQAAVGKGLLSLGDLREITTQMQQVLLKDGTILSAAYYCPHRSDERCGCRKPSPGLLIAAARDFNVDLARSVFIGDSATDIEAAQAVSAHPLLFAAGLVTSEPVAAEITVAQTAQELFDQVIVCLPPSGSAKGDSEIAQRQR
jgi:D-glycero-D-manno-heptose 1,7-bisphosphate phosphatase